MQCMALQRMNLSMSMVWCCLRSPVMKHVAVLSTLILLVSMIV